MGEMQNERDVPFTPETGADRLNQSADRPSSGSSGVGMQGSSAVPGESGSQTGDSSFGGRPTGTTQPGSTERIGSMSAADTVRVDNSSSRTGSATASPGLDSTTRLGPQGDGNRSTEWNSSAPAMESGSDR